MRKILLLLPFIAAALSAQTVVSDNVNTVVAPQLGGGLISSVQISWPQFVTSTGTAVPAGTATVPIDSSGAFSYALQSNASSVPQSNYTFTFTIVPQVGMQPRYYSALVVVPSSGTPVTLSQCAVTATWWTAQTQPNPGQYQTALSFTGNGSKTASSTGAITPNDCVKWDVSGNVVDAGMPCASVSTATTGQFAQYSGSTLVGHSLIASDIPSLNYQAPLGFTPENSANKGTANGYAPLNSSSQVPLTNLPTIPYTQLSGVDAAGAASTVQGASLQKSSNLSDLASVSAALANLGLNNVNNTSDTNKPVSTATQTALNQKANTSSLAASATTDTTNAANISSGTLPVARLANIPNTALVNSLTTVNGVSCALGATCTVSGAENTQTASYTLTATDLGKLVVMNCSSACTVTMKASPANGYYGAIESIGTTTATVSLNGLTFNGSASVPVLLKGSPLGFWSDGSAYYGMAPLVAGANITLSPSANGLTIAANSGASIASTTNVLVGNGSGGGSDSGITASSVSTAITKSGTALQPANNLSDVGSVVTTRTNLGLVASATTDTTNAANITSGTLPNARISALPNASLANSAITVNGATCTLGATCSLGSTPNIQTASYTLTATDLGKLLVMNCSSACAVTMNATPSNGYYGGIQSIGSVTATINLNGLNFNGSTALPVLSRFVTLPFWSDGANYYGNAPLVAGSNITLTPSANGLTVAVTGVATIPTTTNLIAGNGTGGSADSGIAAASVSTAITKAGTALQAASNLSDLGSVATTLTNLGLNNVSNTSDANKPVSTATQTALNLKANLASPALTGTPTINGNAAVDTASVQTLTNKSISYGQITGLGSAANAALTTSVGVTGLDTNVASEKAVRSAITTAVAGLQSALTFSGTGAKTVTTALAGTTGNCVKWLSTGDLGDAGAACGSATFPSTSDLIAGNGSGGGSDSGLLPATVSTAITKATGALQASNNLSDLGNLTTTLTNLGLGNVNNTSDANKPVSTATQTALNLKANTASLASSATTDTTNAANITSGTLPVARLANIPNTALVNSTTTINGTTCTLGATCTVSGAANTQTLSYTLTATDLGKLVIMNCSSACTATLKASPANGFYGAVVSIGTTTATVNLNGLNFNGVASAPVLLKGVPLQFWSDGVNYFGTAQIVAGANVTLTPSSNGLTIAASSGATLPSTTNLIAGNGSGGSTDSGIAAASVSTAITKAGTALQPANNLSDLGSVATTLTNLGLNNVNNTSDANKPISTATQTALNLKANTSSLAASATTDTTNAANISSGTLPNARLSSIPNSALASSSTTVNGVSCALGSVCTVAGAENTQTASYTLTSADLGKLVLMNCSSACTVTLYGTPTNGYFGAIESIGTTTATLSLNGLSFNGASAIPVLSRYRALNFWSDGAAYFGSTPLVAGTNVTLTPGTNGLTIAATSAATLPSTTNLIAGNGLGGSSDSGLTTASVSTAITKAGTALQPANNLSDVSSLATARTNLGLVASATTDTTNAANITSGTLPNARLANIPNSSLANPATTVNGTTCTLGIACSVGQPTNTQTASYSLTSSDLGKTVIMNCSSACTVTLYGAPTNGYFAAIESIGTTTATVSLNSLTFNGSSTAPVLTPYRLLPIWSNGVGYYGTAPLVAGANIALTPSANGLAVGVTGVAVAPSTTDLLAGNGSGGMSDSSLTAANVSTAITKAGTALQPSNNLSELTNFTTALTNLGLNNVNNTSDANKPVSTATQTALNLKANLVSPAFTGAPTINGNAAVDTASVQTLTNKTIASSEVTGLGTVVSAALTTSVGSPGLDTNVASEKAVRTAITSAVSGLQSALTFTGTGSKTASATAVGANGNCVKWLSTGDLGDAGSACGTGSFPSTTDLIAGNGTGAGSDSGITVANTSAAITKANGALQAANNLSDVASLATTLTNLGLNNVSNTSDTNKPVSTATQTALNLKANLASPAFTGTPTINGNNVVDLSSIQTLTNKSIASTEISGLGSVATATLVTTVGSPGLDTNVASEKATRSAIAAAVAGLQTALTFTGVGARTVTASSAGVSGNCVKWLSTGDLGDAGSACGTGSGGGGSGTVNAGTTGQFAYYSANGTAVAGHTLVAADIPALSYQAPLTFTGNGAKTASSTGSITSGDCAKWDASGNIVDAGSACGSGGGGGGGLPSQTGTAGYLVSNGSVASWGNITTGPSGGLDCATTPGVCDLVSSVVPFKLTGNVFSGQNTFGQGSPATISNNYNSQPTGFQASYWNGSAAANDTFTWQNVMGSGSNPTATFTLNHTGSSGVAAVNIPYPITVASCTGCGGSGGGSAVYNAAGVSQSSTHIVMGRAQASSYAYTLTLSGSAAFSSSSSYACTVTDNDSATGVSLSYTSSSSVGFTLVGGSGTDHFSYICIGN